METALRRHLPSGQFVNVSPARSKAMGAVRGRGNRTTEVRLRSALVRAGVRGWKVRPRGVPGNPDFTFPRKKVAVFVDGCFWHGCTVCGHFPKSNSSFWKAKILRNRQRDRQTNKRLTKEGYRVLRFWEHQLATDLPSVLDKMRAVLVS